MSKYLEIGPGRGDFLFHLAEEDPLRTLVGVEYKKKRFEKLVARAGKRGLQNVDLRLGDARMVIAQEFAGEEFDTIFILFSDPWPKRRHAKHRLFQESFVQELHRILKPQGKVFIAHDDPKYLAQIEEVFRSLLPYFARSDEGIDFKTFYAEKWLKEGRNLRSFSYIKIGADDDRAYGGIPCAYAPVESA